ncbi:MAG: tRNA pseudouridine(55) synthase TruB [Spirochaetales bacterium]|nr:tRNA pseudouridine(55) synthase TruB [Spirochaetales bacterium]
MNGIVLLNKPPGITSFQALGAVKRKTGTTKVGHAGTLDRFARGLLVAAVGNFTRLMGLFTSQGKEYRAVAVFGQGTDTLDPEGAPSGTGPVPERNEIEGILGRFRGVIRQRPPEYSAVSVGGVRAYRAARAGRIVELDEREVLIDELVLEDYVPPRATLRVACSKGTYIRALARDIASALDTCAHLEELARIRIGGFRVEEAVAPDDFEPARHLIGAEELVRRGCGLARAALRPGLEAHILSGKTLSDGLFETPPPAAGWNAVFGEDGRLLAVVERRDHRLAYVMVLGGR